MSGRQIIRKTPKSLKINGERAGETSTSKFDHSIILIRLNKFELREFLVCTRILTFIVTLYNLLYKMLKCTKNYSFYVLIERNSFRFISKV